MASQKTQLFGFGAAASKPFGWNSAGTPAGTGDNAAEAKREKAEKLLKAIDRQLRVGKSAGFYLVGGSAGVPGRAAEGVRAATLDDAGEIAVSLGIRMERGAECGLGECLRLEGRRARRECEVDPDDVLCVVHG